MPLPPVDLSLIAAGTGGFAIHGTIEGAFAGISSTGAGDIDGDGFGDLLIGSYLGLGVGTANSQSGEAYVVFGNATGTTAGISLAAVAAGTGGFVIQGEDAGDRAGRTVAPAGDVNGDGFADMLVGARFAAGAGNAKLKAGDSYVVFGRAGFTAAGVRLGDVAAGIGGFVIHGEDAGDVSGFSLATAGDINGDGFDDLIIGAAYAEGAANATDMAGDSYLVFGRAGGFGASIELAEVAAGSLGFVIHGEPDIRDQSGLSVATAGDINGDGFADLIIGAANADGALNAKSYAGSSYVVFGKAAGFGASLDLAAVVAGTGGFVIHGEEVHDEAGFSVAAAGDLNGDGIDDLVIGAPYADAAGNAKTYAGGAYVVFGRTGGFGASLDLAEIAAGTGGFVIHGQDPNDLAGASVAAAGDVNGDGFDDLIIGAYRADGAGNAHLDAGDSYLVFGGALGFAAGIDLAAIAAGIGGFVIHGEAAGDRSGISVASAGDIDGDGFADLVIGTFGADGAGQATPDAGTSYVIFGKNFAGALTQAGTATGETLTGSIAIDDIVAGQGDDILFGNGGADVLIGGAGNDVIHIADLGVRRVDGGSGTDTLALDGAGLLLDLGSLADPILRGIEWVDLTGSGDNRLAMSRRDVLGLSPTGNALIVAGNAGDTLVLHDAGWSRDAQGGGYTLLSNGAAVVLLADPVQLSGSATVALAATDANRAEGDAGTTILTFTATRTGDLSQPGSAAYSVIVGGPRPVTQADFAGGKLPSGVIAFGAGETVASIGITVVGDTMVEGNESFAVRLESLAVGLVADSVAAIGTIGADDAIVDLAAVNSKTGEAVAAAAVFYGGPVGGLEKELVLVTPDNLNISVSGPNWFIHTGSGTDAIAAAGGINVLDGGTGSNFLTGGGGTDTFFVDARGAAAAIWSTVVGLGSGDAVTLWGIAPGGFLLSWFDGLGADGFTGLTLLATAAGLPNVALTMAGFTKADLDQGRLSAQFGTEPGSGSDYMFVYAA